MRLRWPVITNHSLGRRFIFLIVLILSVTMSLATYISYKKQYHSYLESLKEKGNALGKFVALVSPEAILGYDFILLDQYMQEISRREDVVIGAIKSAENNYVTTFINKSHPLLQPMAGQNIADIMRSFRGRSDTILLKFPIYNTEQYLGTFEIVLSTQRAGTLANQGFIETLAVNSMIILVLSLCIYVVFELKVIFPIKKLIYSSERMSQGDLLCHVDGKSRDELGQLTRAFNKMVDSLAENYTQLQLSNEELTRATNAKSTFLANMSHEIRTPLTSILGYAELLNSSDINRSEREFAVQTIMRNGNHLQSVINNILDFSKIEAEKMELDIAQVCPFEILRDVEALIGMQARDKNIEFNIDYCFPLPAFINSDALRLKQVLINLCSNAVKFTDKGVITVSMRCNFESRLVFFDVIDSGIGLDVDERRKIFQSFAQADSSTTRKYGGTGLGLPLAKHLCELMGGTITVHSRKGSGSCFTASVDMGTEPESQVVTNEKDLWRLMGKEDSTLEETLLPMQPAAQIKGVILVAEDTPDNQRLIELYLRKFSREVVMVENGLEAVNAAENRVFDLILMDMQMPVMGGLEAVSRMRHAGITTPIIALTADALIQDKERYLAKGCDGFIAKPINRSEFDQSISAYLQDRSEHQPVHHTDEPTSGLSSPGCGPLISSLPLDDAEFRDLVVRYVIELEGSLNIIRKAYEAKNWTVIRQNAHKIKGSGAAYGFPQLTSLAMQFELRLINREYTHIGDLLSDMELLYERMKQGLDYTAPISEKNAAMANQNMSK